MKLLPGARAMALSNSGNPGLAFAREADTATWKLCFGFLYFSVYLTPLGNPSGLVHHSVRKIPLHGIDLAKDDVADTNIGIILRTEPFSRTKLLRTADAALQRLDR